MTEIDPNAAAKALHTKLQDFRLRITRGEAVSDDELREGLQQLFDYRNGAHTSLESASKKKATTAVTKTAKAKAKQDAANLLGDLL